MLPRLLDWMVPSGLVLLVTIIYARSRGWVLWPKGSGGGGAEATPAPATPRGLELTPARPGGGSSYSGGGGSSGGGGASGSW